MFKVSSVSAVAALTFMLFPSLPSAAQSGPFVRGNDIVNQQSWRRVGNLSDEFNTTRFNSRKWGNATDDWIGRPPGLFQTQNVWMDGSSLRIEARTITPRTVNGRRFTHGGGNVMSTRKAQVGDFIETRMRGNKTFMGSTFWIDSQRRVTRGNLSVSTELDIQETVGIATRPGPNFGRPDGPGPRNFIRLFQTGINSNTHYRSRPLSGGPTTDQTSGNRARSFNTDGAFHTYGLWWRSPTELRFYVDGRFAYTITPRGPFDVANHIMMVVETYDFNGPLPGRDGMNRSRNDRSTAYDWVRTWRIR